jgi:predicted RecA/RadA family phage recombinase
MKNYLGRGDAVYLTAPFAVVSGMPLKINATMFGFAGAPALAGQRFALWVEGEYSVTKAGSQAWTEGQVVNWDNDLRVFTTAAVSGFLKVGVAIEAVDAGAGSTIGKIRLSANF